MKLRPRFPSAQQSPLALAILAITSVPGLALADDDAADQQKHDPDVLVEGTAIHDEYGRKTSTIGGKGETDIRDVPQSVTVITGAVMESQGATSLERALLNVPGVTIGGAEGGQIGNNINLRGFAARTDIYLDGFRDRGQYYRDTYYLDSVEVLKGPSSMLFGRGSTGGVVNQVRKSPRLEDSGEVSAVGGADHYRAVLDFNRGLSDTAAVRVDLMGQSVSSTRDVMKNKDYGAAPSLRFGIGTDTEYTFDALVQHNDDMPDYGLPSVNKQTADVDRDNFYGLKDDRTIQNVTALSARIRHSFSDSMSLLNQTQYNRYETDARETALNSVGVLNGTVFTPLVAATGNATTLPLDALSVRLVSHDRRIEDTTFDNQTDLLMEFDSGPLKHNVAVGAEYTRDTYENQARSRNNLPIVSLVNPEYLSGPANSVTTYGNLGESTATSYAVYANDTLSFGKHWKFVGGARWDEFDAEFTNSINRTNTPGNTALPSASQNVDFTSVRAGLLFQPTRQQSYYVSYGTSFNPSLETLTLTTGTQNVDPEKNRSYEVGAKWDPSLNLSVTAALFQVEKTNARSQISTGVYELDGDIRVKGGEVGIAGRITQHWQVMAGYTHLNAEIISASALEGTQGKTPANTPEDSASLWTTYALSSGWQFGGGGTYMSNRFANNTNVVQVGDYLRFDAMAGYVQSAYEVRLNVLNIADKRDVVSTIQSDGGRSVPEIGRTALVSVGYHF